MINSFSLYPYNNISYLNSTYLLFFLNNYFSISKLKSNYYFYKRVDVLLYMPIKIQSFKKLNNQVADYSQVILLFNKNYINLNKSILNLFYDFGFFKKKFTIFSLSPKSMSISKIITSILFKNPNIGILLKCLYLIVKKQIKLNRNKIKKFIRKMKLYGILILDLPKSKKLTYFILQLKLLTIGFSNSNSFHINLPILNNWLSYKLLYIFYLYDAYKLGLSNKYLLRNKYIFQNINKILTLF